MLTYRNCINEMLFTVRSKVFYPQLPEHLVAFVAEVDSLDAKDRESLGRDVPRKFRNKRIKRGLQSVTLNGGRAYMRA